MGSHCQETPPRLSSFTTRKTSSGHASAEPIRPYQKPVLSFLQQLSNKRIQQHIVCQKVEEMLLQLVTQDNVPSDGPLSLELLSAALKNANLPHERLIPRLVSLACQVMVQSGHPLALKEVHRQLWNLLDGHKKYLTKDLSYNSHHVNDACGQLINHVVLASNKHKRRLDYGTKQQLSRLMKRMQELYDNPTVPFVANAAACNAFIMYYCNQENPGDAYRLLQWMVNESHSHPVELIPRVSSFTATISAFAKSGDPEMSMKMVQWMLSSYKSETGVMPPPNMSCFNGLLDAWAKSGRNDAGQKAEQTLEWMQQLHDTENLDTAPDEVSFAIGINAWARSPGPEAPLRAESILHRMIFLYEGGSAVTPTEMAFTSVMNAWANSTTAEYAPAKVASLLELMEQMSQSTSQLQVTAIPYTVLIKAWEQLAQQSNGRKKLECCNEGLQVLTQMKNAGVTPTAATYNAMITALLTTSPATAVFYFLELEESYRNGDIELDTRTFNCGLNAITALNKPDAAEKSLNVLQRMFDYSRDDSSVDPDETTFNIILKVLSRSPSQDAAEKANSLLLEIEAMPSVKPSCISYLTCIIAWGRSNDINKFQKVRHLLLRFKDAHLKGQLSGKVSPAVYNAALSVCYHNTSPEFRQEALDTAVTTMKELRMLSRVHPDHITYLTLFRALRLLLDEAGEERRDSLLEQEFAKCVSDGLVSQEVSGILHEASPRVFEQFFGENSSPGAATIPAKWSKRTKTRQRQHTNAR
jgi:hypothetical protein